MKCALLFLLLMAASIGCVAQAIPDWVAKAPELPAPTGAVVRVSTPQQFLTAGEALAPGGTMLIEPGVYTMDRPLVLRGKKGITIRSVSGDPASVTFRGKGWEAGDNRDDILRVADCDGVLIAGLTFEECRSYGIKVE